MLLEERKGVGFQALYRAPLAFDGDFRIGKTIIHVTNSPEPDLICRCLMNRKHGFRPLIITTAPGARHAEELADEVGNRKAIEVLDITQFLIANMLELTGFDGTQRRHSFEDLVTHYNQIVEACETDPSLRIKIA